MKDKIKTLTIKYETWKKLVKWKAELDCTFDQLIDKILKIVPASELKGDEKC